MPRNRRRCRVHITSTCTMDSARTWKSAVDAAIEDYVKAGMNICIGHAQSKLLLPLLDALDVHVQVDSLVDVAFMSTTQNTSNLMKERELPDNLSVNFKSTPDLYLAPVSVMDAHCNAVLQSDDFPADRAAAAMASQVVLIIAEDDLVKSQAGISSFPVQLSSFMPTVSVQSLKDMRDIGITDVCLRPNSNTIADVSLSSHALPSLVEDELNRLPFVQSVGLIPASSRTTVIVASNDDQPFDVTPRPNTLASLSDEMRTTPLKQERRKEVLNKLDTWRFSTDDNDCLTAQFVFARPSRANAFVRLVQWLATSSEFHPMIRQSCAIIDVKVASLKVQGLTEMDVMFAQELSNAFARMNTVG